MTSDRSWAAALRAACEHPEAAAMTWRAGGGRVVGVVGWSVPRELVSAAGLLPVRLSADRLAADRLAADRLAAPGRARGSGAPPGPDGAGEPGGASGMGGQAGQAGPGAAAFGRELSPGTARLAAALLSGALDWIDFLVIGRDREDYTRLFYVLRELRRGGAAPGLVPVAFFDLLRLPSRTSARYNRQRAAELLAVIAGWAGRPVTPADLAAAVAATTATADSFGRIQTLRTRRPHPAVTGSDALAAAIAATILPPGELRPLLDAALAPGPGPAHAGPAAGAGLDAALAPGTGFPPGTALAPGTGFPPGTGQTVGTGLAPGAALAAGTGLAPGAAGTAAGFAAPGGHDYPSPAATARGGSGMSRAGAHDIPEISTYGSAGRVFLAGSAIDDLTAYEALEGLGLAIVGEDHEWGDDGSEYPRATRDPLDGIVDRYHFAHGGAARAGLADRVRAAVDRVRAAGPDGVLYLLGPHDEAAGWHLPALREALGGTPLVPVRLRDPAQAGPGPGDGGGWPELRAAGRLLLGELGAGSAAGGTGRAATAGGAAAVHG